MRTRKFFTGLIGLALLAALLLPPSAATADTTITVKPSSMNGWFFIDDEHDSQATATGNFTAPAGVGSAHLKVSGSADGQAIAMPVTSPVPLGQITALGYDTYRGSADAGNNLAVAFQFPVDFSTADALTGFQGRLIFEPYQGVGGNVPQNSWQHWDALAGRWWASKTTSAGSNGSCPQTNPCTWGQVKALWPTAQIRPDAVGLVFKAGKGWAVFDGNVDNFTIGLNGTNTTYNFEPEVGCTSTCYVNSSTGNDAYGGDTPATAKKTIQAAVTQVNAGGTVVVAPGSYPGNVTIGKALALNGAQAGNPVSGRTFNGAGESTVSGQIEVGAANVTIDGLSLTRTGSGSEVTGIMVKRGSDGTTIANNIIDTVVNTNAGSGTAQAVYLENSTTAGVDGADDVSVLNNSINHVQSFGSAKGVLLGVNNGSDASQNTLVKGNSIKNVTSSRGAYGVSVAKTPNVSGLVVRDNVIDTLFGGWAHAVGLEGDTPGALVRGNSVSNISGAGSDVVAVWFEANPSFSSVQVTGNNFDNVLFGVLVHPALVGGPVDGTCNWWGSASGPSGAGPGSGVAVGPNVGYTPWLTSPAPGGACVGPDGDGDGVTDSADNCPSTGNAGQEDFDHDGVGDICDTDVDGDGVLNGSDACPNTPAGTNVNAAGCTDTDDDGVADSSDNCPNAANADQADTDHDGLGNVCDTDDDGDSVPDAADQCAGTPAGTQVGASGCPVATGKDQCKNGGWQTMKLSRTDGTFFKNQGDCVSYASNGK